MGTVGLLPLGMALAGPMADLLGERPLLIGVSIFHLLICAVVLLVPGVKEMKSGLPPYAPKIRDSSMGEQN
jgi:MFS family permease